MTSGFDIEGTNNDRIALISFDRTDNADGTTTLDVTHPNYYNLNCNLSSKFAMTNQNYTNLSTTVVDGNTQKASFVFTGLENEVIDVTCHDTISGDSELYILTQNNFPLLTQLNNFTNGTYGTMGMFGVIDLVSLGAILLSMIGFNRVSPIVGGVMGVIIFLVLGYFQIIEVPTVMVGVIATILMLFIANARKK